MSLFLKLFGTTAEYNTYTADTANFIKPNVSCAMDDLTNVHYNPWVEPIETRVVAKFDVTSTTESTIIIGDYYGYSPFSAIEIDGVVQPTVVSTYTFNTTGEHTVKYTLTDPISIDNGVFYNCSSLTSIVIPSGVTSIGDYVFTYCTSLTSIVIPSGVTSIGEYAFEFCGSLTSIVSNATTAPTIQRSTFNDVKTGGTLTVPSGSSGYDVWMSLLNSYNWTKVEQ